MGLTSSGIGSNLDIEGIISKLMAVERQPAVQLDKKELSFQAKVSGFGTLKGAISQFQSAVAGLSNESKYQSVRASVADASVATITANASAKPGTYSLQVTQIAQAQKLVANGVATQTEPIGKGVITIDFGTISGGTLDSVTGKYTGATFTSGGSGVKTLTIDSTNNSLAGIRDAINGAGMGVTAKIVNDGGTSPYRLSLTSDKTGEVSSMKISVADTEGTGLSTLLNHNPAGAQGLSQTAAAMNAKFTVDGIAVSKASNSVSDVIEGVTFNLLKENSAATTVKVDRDTSAITSSVNAFVKAYNDITQTFRDAMAYNTTTKEAAVLNGEALVRNMQTQVRNILNSPVAGGTGSINTLYQAGVSLDKNGLLKVDSAKLDKAITSNYAEIAGLFASTGRTTDPLVKYGGASGDTLPGSYDVNVSNVATTGKNTGTAAADLVITAANKTFTVDLDGVSADVTLEEGTYADAAALAAEVQSKINSVEAFTKAGSSVQVSQSGGVLTLESNRYGSSSAVRVTEPAGGALKLQNSGAGVVSGSDVAGTINGVAATGAGQLLTAGGANDAAGLSVTITGGSTGARGTITYSKGYATQLNELANKLLAADGPLTARTTGLAESIKGIGKQREAFNQRMVVLEARYRAQFTALDMTIGKMTSTSNYLAQQLAQISSLSSGNE